MNFTPSSIIATFLQSGIIVILLQIMLKLEPKKFLISPKLLFSIGLLFFIRMLLPFEFAFSLTFPSSFLLPAIFTFKNSKLMSIGNIDITVLQSIAFLVFIVAMWKLLKFYKSYRIFKNHVDSLETVSTELFSNKYIQNILYRVVESPYVDSPSIYGIFHPVIILPKGSNYNDKEMQYIVLHELTHYKKGDAILKLLLKLFSCFYWWNPLVFLFNKQMKKIIELRVDNEMMKYFTSQECIEYAECLLSVKKEQILKRKTTNFVLNYFLENKGVLELRVHKILSFNPIRKSSKAITFLILFLSFGSMFFIIEPYGIDIETQDTTFTIENDDNTYLIRNPDATYSLYINNEFHGTIENLESSPSFDGLTIYNSSEEMLNK